MLVGGLGELDVPPVNDQALYIPARMLGTLAVSLCALVYTGRLQERGIDGRKLLFFRDARIAHPEYPMPHDNRPS